LSLKLGWFAEGGDQAGAKFSGKATDVYAPPSEYAGATNAGASAKIELSIDNSGAEARSEHISQVTFTLDQNAGSLHVNGQPIAAGSYNIGGSVYEVSIDGDKVTINISGDPVSSLDGLDLSFVPGPAFDSEDVPFTYTVTVDSAESGAQAVFSGSSHIVADAVADMPTGLGIGTDYGTEGHSAVVPGGTATVEGSASFADNDGSERHYVVVTMRDSGWSIDGVGDNGNLLSKNAINDYWNSLADNKLPEDVLLKILTPGGEQGESSNKQYLMFEAWMDDDGGWHVTAWAAGQDGAMVDVTGDLKAAGAEFNFNQDSGELSYSIKVTAPDTPQDGSATFHTKGITLEVAVDDDDYRDDGDIYNYRNSDDEYDYRNNIAGTPDAKSTTVHVDVVTSGLTVKFFTYEDAKDRQHLDGEGASRYVDHLGNAYASEGAFAAAYPNGLPLIFDLVELKADGSVKLDPVTGRPVAAEDAATDKVTQLTFNDLPTGEQGVIYYKGVALSVDNIDAIPDANLVGGKIVFTNPDLDGFTFKPTPDFSGDVNFDVSSVITSGKSGATASQDQVQEIWKDADGWHAGDAHLHVESVADQAQFGDGTPGDDGIRVNAADGDAANPFDLTASDGVAEMKDNNADGKAEATGWFVSGADESATIKASVDLNIRFTDHDRSETAMVLVEKVDGVTVVGDFREWTDPLSGKVYIVVAEGTVGPNADDLKDGIYDLDLIISSDAREALQDGLKVVVRTEEGPAGHLDSAGNDVAVNEKPVNIPLGWLEGAVSVKTGWVSEDNDAAKYKESGSHSLDAPSGDFEAGSTSAKGAPVQIFAESDTVKQVVFAYDPEKGELQYDGASLGGQLNPATGLWEVTVSADFLDKLTFVPKDGYSDADIELGYTVKLQNGDGRFEVSGSTTVVVDAVADLAQNVSAVVDASDGVIITVEASFPDSGDPLDNSEAHYLLVEYKEGWSVVGGEQVTIIVDAAGNPVQPTGYADGAYTYPAADDANYFEKSFWKVPAENGSNEITLLPEENASRNDFGVKVVVVSEELLPEGSGYEYDYSNNLAYVVKDTVVDLLNARPELGTNAVYEDHLPSGNIAGAANQTPTPSVAIVVSLNDEAGSQDSFDCTAGKNVTMTFSYEGDGDITGASITIGGKTFSFGANDPNGGVLENLGNGSYTYTFPAEGLTVVDGELRIVYNPPLNDDGDLNIASLDVPVISGSGETGYRSTGEGKVIVDAVADLTSHTASVTEISKGDVTYEKVTWGSEITIPVTGSFGDTADGSEHHYLLVQKPGDGWTCDDYDGEITYGGNTYFYKEVGTAENPGYGHSFTLTAPDKGNGSLADGALNIGTGSMAVEGFINGDGGFTYVDKNNEPLLVGQNEVTLENNVSFTPGTVSVNVNVVDGATGRAVAAWEDHIRNQHTGSTTQSPKSGNISITLADRIEENIQSGSISFTYGKATKIVDPDDGSVSYQPGGTPGSFTYYDKNGAVVTDNDGQPRVLTPVFNSATGKWEVNINAAITNDATGGDVQLRYNPPANDSTDLENFNYDLVVSTTNSGETSSISGSINTTQKQEGTGELSSQNASGKLVVDAAADQAQLGAKSVEYAEKPLPEGAPEGTPPAHYDAAQSGAPKSIGISATVTFDDYQDNSELHYVVLQRNNVEVKYEDGSEANDGSFGDLSSQTITISGANGYSQVIVYDAAAKTAIVTIYNAGKNAVGGPISLTDAQVAALNGGNNTAVGFGEENYFSVPVLNEFLQLAGNGTVTVEIELDAPNVGQDAVFRPEVGGYVVEQEYSGYDISDNFTGDSLVITANDVSLNTDPLAIKVNVATSRVTISMIDDRVYENGQPRSSGQHSGKDGNNDVGGFIFGGKDEDGNFVPGKTENGEYTASEWLPGGYYDAAGNLVVTDPEGLKAACAEMLINDLHDGERANLTFSMSGPAVPDDPDLAADMDYGSLWMEIDGTLTKVGDFSYDQENGVTCTITVDGLEGDAGQNLYFLPGKNYDSNNIDLNLDSSSTVTDLASGHNVHVYNPEDLDSVPPPLHIVVDAVANEAVLGDRVVDGNEFREIGDTLTGYAQGSGKIELEVKSVFHDTDGSEEHYVLVEAVRGVDLFGQFHEDFAKAGCNFKDSNNLHYEFDEDGNVTRVFYKVPVALADDPNVAKYFDVADNPDGSITVTLEVDLSFDGKDKESFEISTGAMTIDEDSDYRDSPGTAQVGDYYDKKGNYVSQELSESKSNDVSVVIDKPIKVCISQATATAQIKDSWVYEDDRRFANTEGSYEPRDGGMVLDVKFSPGSSDFFGTAAKDGESGDYLKDENGDYVKSDGDVFVTVTYDESRGSITYTDGEGKPQSVASGDSVPLGADGKPLYPLTFTPAEGRYDDSDINITYTLTVTDSKSGDSHDVSFNQNVYFDAVAQKPEAAGVDYAGEAEKILFDEYTESHNVNLSVTFTDMDGHTDHFILVEYKAGWQLEIGDQAVTTTVIGPDGKVYWQIKVTDDMIRAGESDAKADSCTVDIDVALTTPRQIYGDRVINAGTEDKPNWITLTGNDKGDIQYGGMSRDNTDGDKELRWDNNWAFDVSGQIEVDYKLGGGGHGDWDIRPNGPAFENDMPLAHIHNDVKMGGAQILITGTAANKNITFTYSNEHGTLQYEDSNGKRHDLEPGEIYNRSTMGELFYVPKEGSYSDADVDITANIDGLGSKTITVIVDAVAQAPDNVSAAVNGNSFEDDGKVYTGETAEIEIKGHIPDMDDSEEHFVLISKEALLGGEDGAKTSISVDGYELIQVDGEAYYKVPIEKADVDTDGNFSVKVNVTTSNGENDYRLTYGVGSIERPTDGEMSADNNLALDINGTVDFYVALANTTVSMKDVDALESHSGADRIETGLTITVGDHDVVDSITITVNVNTGTLYIGDDKLVISGGKVVIDAKSHPDLFEALNSSNGEPYPVDLVFVPDQYENQDVKISASVQAHDERSHDSGGGGASSQIDIDALATAPILGGGGIDYAGDHKAATVGGAVNVALTVTFNDINADGKDLTPEFHYILVESKANWDYPDGLVKTYDQNRTEFLKVPVDEAIQYCHANKVGSFPDDATGIVYQVTFNKDGSATVTAQVPVELPDLDRPGDHSYNLKYGGQTVDTPFNDENESIYNDVSFNTKGEVTIDVGVVESNAVSADADGVAEHQGTTGEAIEISFTADGNNDVVQTVFIDPNAVVNGELRVVIGGEEQNLADYLVDGFYALPADADISFVPDAYWSGTFEIPFTATVVDGKSGAGNSQIYDGSISINVTGVDSAPEAVSAAGPSFDDPYGAAKGGADVDVTVTATFPDHDGSEWHYVLVEQVDGWGCPDAVGTYTHGSGENAVTYWKVRVEAGGEAQADGSRDWNVKLIAPAGGADDTYNFKTGALASETELPASAASGAFAPGTDLNIDVANVNSGEDAASITLGTGREDPVIDPSDPAAANAHRAQLTIGVDPENLGASDELLSLNIEVPEGCKVFDADGIEVQPVDGVITLDVTAASNGDYYFEAGANKSGSFEIEITYNFKDSTSGATGSVTVDRSVTITPVTDVPGDLVVTNSAPTVTAGHTATVTVNMAADFKDMDGSEQHFFLVKAPAGVSAPAGWSALEQSDPIFLAMVPSDKAESGDIYYIYNLAQGESGVSPSFTVNADYAGDTITYVAGSYETADGAGGGGKHDAAGYEFTTGNVELHGVNPIQFNLQPAVSGGNAAGMSDALRHADVTVTGQLGFADDDNGDAANIRVTALGYGQTNGAVLGEGQDYAGWLAVEGSFGTLYVNPQNGVFEYKLDNGVDPATLAPESFNITINDGYGAANSENSSSITISFDTPNNKPEATGELVKTAGGGNERGAEEMLLTGNMGLHDQDGDIVSITSVAGVTEKSSGENGDFFEVPGAFGKLRLFEDGRYEYRLENEHATGTERFAVNFQDQFSAFGPLGGMATADIVINVTPVNHAPVLTIPVKAFGEDPVSAIKGTIDIRDIDLAQQGDSLTVTVTAMGQTYEMPASGLSESIETEYGSFQINFATGEYIYTPNDPDNAPHLNVWDNAVITVTDQGSLSHSAILSVELGEPGNAMHSIFGGNVGGELRGLEDHDNLIYGGDGVDRIYGGDGNDTLYGGAGEDIIHTGAGNNVVYGGAGDDIIHVGTGANELNGGEGGDVFVWSEFGGEDTIMDFDFSRDSAVTRDQLDFKDIFGNEGAGSGVDSLLAPTLDVLGTPPNTFTFGDAEGGRTITAQFNSNTALTLTLQNGADDTQVININAASGSEFYTQDTDLNEASARAILEAIIKGDM
ncbi:hypothetical protein LJC15_00395, partial [Desulfovibrio sp. OttesenSCG-928-G11]|nr:hypothetical protein [Desulfovibrio sp. OttesenSCG-928-G11]